MKTLALVVFVILLGWFVGYRIGEAVGHQDGFDAAHPAVQRAKGYEDGFYAGRADQRKEDGSQLRDGETR